RPTPAMKNRERAVEAELKRLRERPAPLVKIPLPPRKGDMGVFEPADGPRPGLVDVLAVVDEANAVVRAWHGAGAAQAAGEDATFVDLWVRGIDTKRLAAGYPASLPRVFRVTGNQLFDTTCGKRSLPLLEPVDVAPYRRAAAK